MTPNTPSTARRALGNLTLGLICAGGLLAGVAAVPQAHAGASVNWAYQQHSRINHGGTRTMHGLMCHDCGRFGPYGNLLAGAGTHAARVRPAGEQADFHMQPYPTCPTCRLWGILPATSTRAHGVTANMTTLRGSVPAPDSRQGDTNGRVQSRAGGEPPVVVDRPTNQALG